MPFPLAYADCTTVLKSLDSLRAKGLVLSQVDPEVLAYFKQSLKPGESNGLCGPVCFANFQKILDAHRAPGSPAATKKEPRRVFDAVEKFEGLALPSARVVGKTVEKDGADLEAVVAMLKKDFAGGGKLPEVFSGNIFPPSSAPLGPATIFGSSSDRVAFLGIAAFKSGTNPFGGAAIGGMASAIELQHWILAIPVERKPGKIGYRVLDPMAPANEIWANLEAKIAKEWNEETESFDSYSTMGVEFYGDVPNHLLGRPTIIQTFAAIKP